MNKIESDVYLKNVFPHIPRLLSLLDRAPLSPSAGCFDRSYWLHRKSDFPSAVCQIGLHPLVLLWSNKFNNNIYYHNDQTLEWILTALKYTIKIQNSDGSFDEWYPNERGWAGPTGYILNAITDAFSILSEHIEEQTKIKLLDTIKRAANFLASHDEKYILVNHYAMSVLPIYKAYTITKENILLDKFEQQLSQLFSFCSEEGWGLEYDGADIGYLFGTLSFLGSLHKHYPSSKIEQFVETSLSFLSYNIFPNGSFGGSLGSRNTNHYYPFALEYWAHKFPLAKRLADFFYELLEKDLLISPATQEDHYLLYRLPDFILAQIERKTVNNNTHQPIPLLPFERGCFEKFFEHAKIFIKNDNHNLWICNIHKGGAIKGVGLQNKIITGQNSGWIIRSNKKIISTLWNDDNYQYSISKDRITIQGSGHYIMTKLFTPTKNIIFRMILLTFCWNKHSAYLLKVFIRNILMIKGKRSPISFRREIKFHEKYVEIIDQITKKSTLSIHECIIGGNLPTRYVPQSRYFHPEEIMIRNYRLSPDELTTFNKENFISITTHIGKN